MESKRSRSASSRSGSRSGSPVRESAPKYEAFVRNLPFTTSQNDIEDFFGSCGTIENVNLLKDRDGRSKGIAFVKFTSKSSLEKAIAKSGESFGGRDIVVQAATPKEDRPAGDRGGRTGGDPNSKSVFVGNLAFNTNEDALRDVFEGCGEIGSVRVAKDQDGRPRGFAHIDFADNEGAQNAIRKSGSDIDGRAIRVDFSNGPRGGGGGRGGFGGDRDRRSGGYGGDRRSGGYGGGDRRSGGGYGGSKGGYDRGDRDRGDRSYNRNESSRSGGYNSRRRDDY